MLELARRLLERRAECVLITDSEEALHGLERPEETGACVREIRLPVCTDEMLTPLVAIIAGQLFAYHLARVKGRDPDAPRGLRKVTVTR
jgi:glucosamine--fructose-6-phosphate aminotransferase (isomerizing)